jgi:hypothetical protein
MAAPTVGFPQPRVEKIFWNVVADLPHFIDEVYIKLLCASGTAYTAVTPAKGGFMRLTGRIEIRS